MSRLAPGENPWPRVLQLHIEPLLFCGASICGLWFSPPHRVCKVIWTICLIPCLRICTVRLHVPFTLQDNLFAGSRPYLGTIVLPVGWSWPSLRMYRNPESTCQGPAFHSGASHASFPPACKNCTSFLSIWAPQPAVTPC